MCHLPLKLSPLSLYFNCVVCYNGKNCKYKIFTFLERTLSMKGKLFILSGPSGVGKGTVRESILSDKEVNLTYSISYTTRAPRNGEINGVHYFFVSREYFENAIKNDELLEYAVFVDNYYGTPKKAIDDLLNQGKNVLLEIEVQGAKQVMKKCPEAITIFMVPPSFEELEKRIRGRRSEPEDIVQQRLSKAKVEMQLQKNYKYVVVNDTIENASKAIIDIIKGVNKN